MGESTQPDELQRRSLKINLDDIRTVAMTGVVRAAAFMGIGLKATRDGPPLSVSLARAVNFQFLPDPLDPSEATKVATEYESWLIGCGLKELDQFFGLFLDRVWDALRAAEVAGQVVEAFEVSDGKFAADTNISRKLAKLRERFEIAHDLGGRMAGISFARNALTHHAGVVRRRDFNEGNALAVEWTAPETVMIQDGVRTVFDGQSSAFDTQSRPCELEVRFVQRRKSFGEGERIVLTPHDLAEVCWYYSFIADGILRELKSFIRMSGVELTEVRAPA